MTGSRLLLNVGSGDLPAPPPWVNVDANPDTRPDVVGDITGTVPIADGHASQVYCGHVLEHVELDQVGRALTEIRRLLHPGGQLCVVGPDYDRASQDDPPDPVLLQMIRDGGNRWSGDRHMWLSTETAALSLIRPAFPDARPVPVADVPARWPVPFRHAWWQFAILATKEAP